MLIAIAVILIAAVATLLYLAHNAEPLLKSRVVQTLSVRFNSPVELDHLHISVAKGLQVSGEGLRILYLAGPTKPDANPVAPPPMLSVRSFQFRSGIRQLLEPTTRVLTVYVEGMQINIPPHEPNASQMPDNPKKKGQPRISILVDKIVCTDSKIVLETRPGKDPLVFNISSLTLNDVGPKNPLTYDAVLTNPKPVGNITSQGRFGPWQNDNPRDTALDGNYQFTDADLSSIHGIAGTLSSTGSFSGTLGDITANGTADVPDFKLDVSEHPVPLHTTFHATVDGTTGNVILSPVDAQVLHSTLHATGSVTHSTGVQGHTINLQVDSTQARIEDMLRLGVKASPPFMNGALTIHTRLNIPPGPVSVTKKMHLQGDFTIHGATYTNKAFQQSIDKLSMRAQGRPKEANDRDAVVVPSSMSGTYNIANSLVDVTNLQYQLPGAHIQMEGRSSLDGATLDFHGIVRTDATASQMTTGWKSFLLQPLDRFLRKGSAGVEIPITVSGSHTDPKISIDLQKMTFGHQTQPSPVPPK
jgi:AsmA-like C-terminal region